MEHCKNCGLPVENEYCSHCGQKIMIPRISFGSVLHEIFHFFTHLEKGFLFTSRQLLLDPGRTIISYIDGKRKKYQPPVSYFLIWTTIFILTLYLFEKIFGENRVINYNDYFGPGSTTNYAISHLSIMLTMIIPFQAFYLYLLITKQRYNYFETLVAGIFAIGTIIQLQFIFAIIALLYAISGSPLDLRYSDVFKMAYFIWLTISILKEFSLQYKMIRGVLFIILAAGTFTVWRIFGVPEIARLFMTQG
ncbi:MAG TPA: DUF3667 domain-containing protein [Saprospiraceae bacterium]